MVNRHRGLCAAASLALLGMLSMQDRAAAESVQPISTASFLNSIGINTHLTYLESSGDGSYNVSKNGIPNVQTDLLYLGITHVRDGFGYDYNMDRIDKLGALGIRFDALMGTGPGVVYSWEIANINARASIIDAVEGPNEVDHWPAIFNGQTGNAAAAAEQKALFSDIHGSSALNGPGHTTPVYNLTVANPASLAALGSLAPYADYQSVHAYPPQSSPQPWLNYWVGQHWAGAPGLPDVITECGYSTVPQVGNEGSVSESAQAKYNLILLMEAQIMHISRAYLYELMDGHADPAGQDREQHFGQFRADNTPKPSAVALHNLFTILRPAPGSAAVSPLSFTLSGMPASAHSLLMEKSNGTYFLAIWNEQPLWNTTLLKDIVVAPVRVSLDLGLVAKSVKLYDPLKSAAASFAARSITRLVLNLPDHPIFVEIDPQTPQIGHRIGIKQSVTGGHVAIVPAAFVPAASYLAARTKRPEGL